MKLNNRAVSLVCSVSLLISNLASHVAHANSACMTMEETNLFHIFSNYNENLRPPPHDNTTVVTVDVFIKNILWVNEVDRRWKLEIILRQEWLDTRLQFSTAGCPNYKYLTLTSTKDIWTPDLYFPLEEEGYVHEVPQPNVKVRIHPTGDVLYSVRMTMIMDCSGQGSFRGEFMCPIVISSYAHTVEEIILEWREQDTIQMDMDRINLQEYTIGRISTEISDYVTIIGKYSNAVAKFGFLKNLCRA